MIPWLATDPIPKNAEEIAASPSSPLRKFSRHLRLAVAFLALAGAGALAGCGGGDSSTKGTTPRAEAATPKTEAAPKGEAQPSPASKRDAARGLPQRSGEERQGSAPPASANAGTAEKGSADAAAQTKKHTGHGGESDEPSPRLEGTAGEAAEANEGSSEPEDPAGAAPPGSTAAEQASAE